MAIDTVCNSAGEKLIWCESAFIRSLSSFRQHFYSKPVGPLLCPDVSSECYIMLCQFFSQLFDTGGDGTNNSTNQSTRTDICVSGVVWCYRIMTSVQTSPRDLNMWKSVIWQNRRWPRTGLSWNISALMFTVASTSHLSVVYDTSMHCELTHRAVVTLWVGSLWTNRRGHRE